MNRAIATLLLSLFCSCHGQDKKLSRGSAYEIPLSSDTVTQLANSPGCKKCDKVIIESATEHWDKLTDAQLEQFLCSFDTKCKLAEKYKNSGETYEWVAFESMVVQLDRHLSTCIKLFDTNKNIDFAYILSLLEKVAGHDLPWPSIISQLEKKKTLTPTEQKILNAIRRSESEFKKKYKRTK